MTHQLLHLGNLSDLDYEGSCMQCLMQLTFWWNTLVPSIWKKSDIREWRHGRRDGESLISCLQISMCYKLKGQ